MLNKRKFKGGLLTFWTDPVMLNHKYIYVKSAICRRKEAATVEEVMEKVLRSGMDLLVGIGRYALPALAFLIVLRCLFSLLRNRPRPVTLGILVNGANGDEFLLNHWETSIGRNKTCDIFLAYNTISRFHAVLSRRKEGWTVFDTYSKTGVYVNGKAIERKSPVYDGDSIMMGNVVLFLRAPDSPPPAGWREAAQIDAQPQQFPQPVEMPEEVASAEQPVFVAPADVAAPEYEDIRSNRTPVLLAESTGEVCELYEGSYLIGRSPEADFTLPVQTVSARHARLSQYEDGWVIEDLGSKSGTMVNGKRIGGPQTLFDGDHINVGGVTLRFYEDYTG